MANIATAYVQIVPSTKGMAESLTSAMDGASTKAGATASNNLSSGFLSGAGKVASAAVKVTTAAISAAVTGVGALTTAAVNSYAEYEQLIGGTELMFGEASDYIVEKSQDAYKTVQMSSNDYLTQVNGFATGLKTSLEGNEQAAAELADKIVNAEADIVAATGNTQENVQNAFNGIMKSNYSMLDNLQIGITPTKEGFQEVIDKVNEWNAANGEATDYVIDNLADCQNALVDYIEMVGMSGYAQDEASETIQGSLASMKGAWSNLLTGLADDEADLSQLMQNLIDSIVGYTDESGTEVKGFLDNIIPVVETTLVSIGTLIEELVPTALDLIPTLINDVLPDIVSAGTSLVQGLITSMSENMGTVSEVLTQLIDAIVDLLPDLISLGGQIVTTLVSAITSNLDSILDAAGQILTMLMTGLASHSEEIGAGAIALMDTLMGFLSDNSGMLIDTATTIVLGLATGFTDHMEDFLAAGWDLMQNLLNGILEAIPVIVEQIPILVDNLVEYVEEGAPTMLEAATSMFLAIVDALPEVLIAITDALPQIIDAIVAFLTGDGSSQILESALYMFLNIVAALPEILGSLLGALGQVIVSLCDGFNSYTSNMKSAALELFGKIKDGLEEVAKDILSKVKDKVTEWANAIKDKVSDFVSIGQNLITGLWNGISDKASWLYNQISGMGTTVVNKVKALFGVQSPSKVFAEIGGYLAEGLGVGWDKEMTNVKEDIGNDLNFEGSINVEKNMASSSSDLNNQQTMTLHEYIDLGDTRLKEIISQYTLTKMGNETRATKVSQGGVYSYV